MSNLSRPSHPSRPLNTIVPALLESDRRPTLIRPAGDRNTIFSGWGPKL
jgi:hypothetical protein